MSSATKSSSLQASLGTALVLIIHLIGEAFPAGAMVGAQYLACLCDIAACLSGSQEVAELAHCTDNIAQVCFILSCEHLIRSLACPVVWLCRLIWPGQIYARQSANCCYERVLMQSLLD